MGVIRQSWVASFEICPRRAFYDSTATEFWASEVTAMGTAYHAGVEHYYRGRMLGRPVTPTIGDMHEIHLAAMSAFRRQVSLPQFSGFTSSFEEAMNIVLGMLDAYFGGRNQWGREYEVVGVEMPFRGPFIPGWDASGTMDLVLRARGDFYLIVDQKTSGRAWAKNKETARKNIQSSWYIHWLTKLKPGIALDHVLMAFDIITTKGVFERRVVDRSEEEVQGVLRKAAMVCDLLDSGIELPGNTSTPLCSSVYCAHWNYCPFGAQMERGALSVTSGPTTTQRSLAVA